MPGLKSAFEDDMLAIARDADHRSDLRAVKVDKGVAKVPDSARTTGADGKQRHGDYAVALALAWAASEQDVVPIEFETLGRRDSGAALDRFTGQATGEVTDTGWGSVGGGRDLGGYL
jgi:phage FluMu gp28-like protein